mgnify:CR=1 FL=1
MTNPRDRIEELRAVAEKANPSLEWKISGDACVVRMGGEIVADYSMARRGEWETDAEYLVAFQPSVVLSLLQALSDLGGGGNMASVAQSAASPASGLTASETSCQSEGEA